MASGGKVRLVAAPIAAHRLRADAATQVSSFEAAPERPAFFEAVHAAATAKRVAHILVADKTELCD